MQQWRHPQTFHKIAGFLPVISLILILNGCGTGRVSDADGNKYQTVQIGDQLWMAENLKATRLNDGTPIEMVTGYEEWAELETPAYCWYNNDSAHREDYGALYNWFVVETDRLCPEGWHVPSDEEWNRMVSVIADRTGAGGALKESGTSRWRSPNDGATNETGFSALPGGYRSYLGTFNLLRASGYWWSSTEASWYSASGIEPSRVIFRSVQHDNAALTRHISEKTNGFSVRCVKDE